MKKKIYYGDFETTTITEDNKVRVYLWVVLSGKKVYKGGDIESFIDFCRNKKCIIFFHNLRFDFSYIHYYLLKHNIECSVLEKKGVIYNAKFWNIELRDSMNFMPMSLEQVGEEYCVRYKKTSIDYICDYNHVATQEEIDYCINDCRVLEEGLNVYLSTMEEILVNAGAYCSAERCRKKLTNAGIAFEAFKELSMFENCCPKTTQNEYELYKGAYKGGFVYSNPKGICENVLMIDCNSMYPYMYSTIELPVGRGFMCKDEEDSKRFKFCIYKLWIKYDLKEGFIPIIGGGIGKYGGIEYKSSSGGNYEELTLCTKDFELIKEFYDIDYSVQWVVGFDTIPYFYKEFADTFIKVKNKEKGVKRSVAKILLNSPYGKTAMNGFNEIKRYFVDDEKEIVKSEITGYEVDCDSYQYLPHAIAITAGARYYLLKTALQIGFDKVHYMDTDSIKFDYCETGIPYDNNILGAWKNEGFCKLFKTLAPKKYVYWGVIDNGGNYEESIHYACAGFNKKTMELQLMNGGIVTKQEALRLMGEFDKGLELECLQSKVVTGGRALIPVLKKIN